MAECVIVGAGPCGLAAGLATQGAGFSTLVLDQGCLTNSVYHFPTNLVFFSSADLLEIGGIPFPCAQEKPDRRAALAYYRRVTEHFALGVRQNTKVTGLRRLDGGRGFSLETSGPSGEVGELQARHVVLATGYYDNPNRLSIPAEDGPKLSHYYTEAHPYWQRDVLVVGGGNSAVESALDLYRHGARVTLVHREAALSPKLKPWVEPDIRNRLRDQAIKGFFQSELRTIGPDSVTLSTPGGPVDLPNSFVFALTGYHPDPSLLRGLGAAFDPESGAPVHDPQTMETTVPGLFIAGTLAAGNDQNQIFIENGRLHGNLIATALLERRLER